MALLREFYPEVNQHVPGVATLIIKPHLVSVLQTFCTRSRIWQLSLGPYSVTGPRVDLTQLASAELENAEVDITDVVAVEKDGERVDKDLYQQIPRKGISWKGTPPGEALVYVAAVKPRSDTREVDDQLLEDWRTAISHGVAARLMMQPRQEWSNQNLAQWHQDKFDRMANEAMFEALNKRRTYYADKPMGFW